jgi:hypothetical protein
VVGEYHRRPWVKQEDALALLARTQALTSQSLQQAAEGLTRWTDAEMRHRSKDWPVFDSQVIHYIAWKREWTAHHQENYPGLQGDALRRVLVERCLRPADKDCVRYKSTVAQVWEYLDRAYQRQDVFLHDLMKPIFAHKEIGEKNYRALEEYLDLLIRTFDIAEEAGMLPVVLHMNNLRPMYEKWLHGEQAKWWTHAERFDVIQQPLEFRRYIQGRYRVVATLASHMVIASAGKSGENKDDKKKDGGQKQGGGGKPPQKANISAVTQQSQQQQQPAGHPQRPQQPCRLGASLCKEAHPLDKCEEFKKMSPKQRVVKANDLQLCLICLKHRADRECFTKARPEFEGCSEGGCGMEHHPLLHWALIVARLFQVQVVANSYPPGTQVFQLRQRVKMCKTEVGQAFDGGSNQSFVTMEYASRKRLKKVGFAVPVIGFGSPEPVMGELYEVPLRASGKRDITIKAEAVEAIHNSPPPGVPRTSPRGSCSRGMRSRRV